MSLQRFVAAGILGVLASLSTAPLSADMTLRFAETFEVDDRESRRSESVLRFDATRARWDSQELGTFILDTDANRLLHLRRDGTAVSLSLPLDLAEIVAPEEREEFEQNLAFFGSETTATLRSAAREIEGLPTRLVHLETVYDLLGRAETELWLARDLDDDAAAKLLGLAGQFRFGTIAWMDWVGEEGNIPLAVESTIEGPGATRTRTLRLKSVSRDALAPDVFELPEETPMVPFRLSDYVRGSSG